MKEMSLLVAVLDGDRQRIFDLIFEEADVEESNDVGNRPLHAAAFTGNVEIARLLVKAGANINAKGAKGRTPLHIAAMNDRGEAMVKFLIEECQANPQEKDDLGRTPRDYASPNCAGPLDQWMLAQWSSILGLETEGARNGKQKEKGYDHRIENVENRQFGAFSPRSKHAEALLEALNQIQLENHGQSGGSTASRVPTITNESLKSPRSRSTNLGEIGYDQPQRRAQFGPSNSTPTSPRTVTDDIDIGRRQLSGHESTSPRALSDTSRSRESYNAVEDDFEENDLDLGGTLPEEPVRDGFFVEVDGARVFVPMTVSSLISDTGPRQHLLNDDTNSDDGKNETEEGVAENDHDGNMDAFAEEILRRPALSRTVQLTSSMRSKGQGLGMQLGEDLSNDLVVGIRSVRKGFPADAAGVRVGDIPVTINGTPVRGLPIEDIVDALNAYSTVELVVERVIPVLYDKLIDGSLEWKENDDEAAVDAAELFKILEDPPSSLNEEEIAHFIHAFQEVMTLYRRGECGPRLKRVLEQGLNEEASSAGGLTAMAATVVHRALRIVESRSEEAKAEAEDDEAATPNDPRDLIQGVIRGILNT